MIPVVECAVCRRPASPTLAARWTWIPVGGVEQPACSDPCVDVLLDRRKADAIEARVRREAAHLRQEIIDNPRPFDNEFRYRLIHGRPMPWWRRTLSRLVARLLARLRPQETRTP